MLLDVAFRYRVTLSPGYGPSAYLLPAATQVAVPEAAGAEAPIVAECIGDERPVEPFPTMRRDARLIFPLRTYNGRLYCRSTIDGPAGVRDMDWLRARAADGRRAWIPGLTRRDYDKVADAIPHRHARRVTGSDLEAVECGLQAWAGGSVFIDGELYEACPEPILHFAPDYVDVALQYSSRWSYMVFRLDEAAHTREWMEADMGLKVERFPNIVVHRPEDLRFPGTMASLCSVARSLGGFLKTRSKGRAVARGRDDVPSKRDVAELEALVEMGYEKLESEGTWAAASELGPALAAAVEDRIGRFGRLLEDTHGKGIVSDCNALLKRWSQTSNRLNDPDLDSLAP